jgi:hypothetical protein
MNGQTLKERAEDGCNCVGDDIDSDCVPRYLEAGVAQRHDGSVEEKKRAFDGQMTGGIGQLDGNRHLVWQIRRASVYFAMSRRVGSTHIDDFDHAVHSHGQGMLSGAIVNAWNGILISTTRRPGVWEKGHILRSISAYSPKAKLYQDSQQSICFQLR